MTTAIHDPRLFLPPAGEITRLAREGLVAEWDFLTFDGGNPLLMLDQSGNARNALFTSAPTKTTAGVSFNGTFWADATLPALGYNYTALVAYFTSVGAGFYVFGNRDISTDNGLGFRTAGSLTSGAFGVGGGVPQATGANYQVPIAKVVEYNQARAKQVNGGILDYGVTQKPNTGPDTQTVWRIGAGRQSVGGSPAGVAPTPLQSSTIAYAMVWNKVTSERQDAAIAAFLRAKLALRGVVVAL